MKRLIKFIAVLLCIAFLSSGCEWLGRMTTKAENGIQKGVQKMETGIEKMQKEFEKGQKESKKESKKDD